MEIVCVDHRASEVICKVLNSHKVKKVFEKKGNSHIKIQFFENFLSQNLSETQLVGLGFVCCFFFLLYFTRAIPKMTLNMGQKEQERMKSSVVLYSKRILNGLEGY